MYPAKAPPNDVTLAVTPQVIGRGICLMAREIAALPVLSLFLGFLRFSVRSVQLGVRMASAAARDAASNRRTARSMTMWAEPGPDLARAFGAARGARSDPATGGSRLPFAAA